MQLAAFILSSAGAPFKLRSLRQKWGFSLAIVLLSVAAMAQNNPVPQIVGPVHPDAVPPGSGAFTLSVYGANFVPGSVVNWNYQQRVTTYISGHEIQAQILATDVETNTAGYITVTNPSPGGGSSSASWAQVEVHDPISTISLNSPAYYDFGVWALSAADFTHDASLSVVGQYGPSLGFGYGQSTGAFGPWSLAGADYECCNGIGYGDFNGDGNVDIVFQPSLGSGNHLRVMLGNGLGAFNSGPSLDAYFGSLGFVLVGDFNKDGSLDLVTSGPVNLATYLGNGNGTFKAKVFYPYPSGGLGPDVIAGDIDGDGVLDLIALQTPGGGQSGFAFWFLRGNGDGTFRRPVRIAGFANVNFSAGMLLSDFNGDGNLDLAFCTATQVGVMLGNGDGTFQSPVLYSTGSTNGLFSLASGDMNSDGNEDLLLYENTDSSGWQVAIFFGNGDGTFQPQQTISLPVASSAELGLVLGDFNRDGLLDAVFRSDLGMNVYLGAGPPFHNSQNGVGGLAHPFIIPKTGLPHPSRAFCGRVGLRCGLQSP
jgi:hypothetical protein